LNKKIIVLILIIILTIISLLLYNIVDKPRLLYTIYSARINCPPSELLLYDNGTYKFSKNKGKYDYDINLIINNLDNYEENEHGPFVLIDEVNNKKYKVYDNNKEFINFVKSNNIELDTCINQ